MKHCGSSIFRSPHLRDYVSALEGEKAQQSRETLAQIWKVDQVTARTTAESLVEIGFFEPRGSGDNPDYWVPFLYRDSLRLVQGEARVDS